MNSGYYTTITGYRIAQFYHTNGQQLNQSVQRIASGKNFSKPADNIPDYFRAQKMVQDTNGYKTIRRDIGETLAMLEVAEAGATTVFENLTKMKETVEAYYDDATTDEEKSFLEKSFNELAGQVTFAINNTVYDGKQLIADTVTGGTPLKTLYLDPNDTSQTMSIDFSSSEIADTGSLDITVGESTALSQVTEQLHAAGMYLGKLSGYVFGLNAQYNVVENTIKNTTIAQHTISDIDEGQETVESMKRNIQQQAAVAMLAQSNMVRQGVLMLVM